MTESTIDRTVSPAQAWLLACRPVTLTAGLVPVLVGTGCALAGGELHWGAAIAAALGAILIQIGTNLVNDAADFDRGADDHDRIGPLRVAQAGLLTVRQLWRGVAVVFGLALLAGLYLTWLAGWPVVLIGLLSIVAGIGYTAGPYPLGYHGLGELLVFGFFGLAAVAGTVYVETGAVGAVAWGAGVPIGALATGILVINNLRDRETDARAGKRTLAVRLGPRGARIEFISLLVIAYASPLLLAALAGGYLLLPLATLPLAIRLGRQVLGGEGPPLNLALRDNARLLLGYGVLLAIGLAVSQAG